MEFINNGKELFFLTPEIRKEGMYISPEEYINTYILKKDNGIDNSIEYKIVPVEDKQFYNKALDMLMAKYENDDFAKVTLIDPEVFKFQLVRWSPEGVGGTKTEVFFRVAIDPEYGEQNGRG